MPKNNPDPALITGVSMALALAMALIAALQIGAK